MRISYNKLWKMLIDKEMNKGANITTDVLLKICEAMDCKLEDIMETIKD